MVTVPVSHWECFSHTFSLGVLQSHGQQVPKQRVPVRTRGFEWGGRENHCRVIATMATSTAVPGVPVNQQMGVTRDQPLGPPQVSGNIIAMPAAQQDETESVYVFGFPVDDHSIAPLVRNVSHTLRPKLADNESMYF